MRRPSRLFVALLATGLAGPAAAQPPRPARAAPAAADTALVRVLVAAAVDVASPPRAHLRPPGRPFPWRLTVADSASPTGRRLAQALAQALQARPLLPADTVHAFLTVTEVQVVGGRLRAALGIGLAWRCPHGAWMRSSTGYRLQARRVRGQWQPARLAVAVIADPAPCERLPPESPP